MTEPNSATPQPLPARTRAYLSVPELAEVWHTARVRLERNGLRVSGVLTLTLDDAAADRLSGLLGRTVPPGAGRRITLQDLDTAMRHSAAEQGLISVLEDLAGRPLVDRSAARRDTQEQWAQVWRQLDTSLADAGLAEAHWVPDWIAGLRRTGILTRAGTDAATRALTHAIATLGVLATSSASDLLRLAPDHEQGWRATSWELAELATRVTNNAHGLDDSQLASAVLLRAAAHALDRPVPESATDRRESWQALGVATDSISGTVLVWRLRPPGADPWSVMLRTRANLGLVTHLTLHEIDQAGQVAFAESGQTVFACENPQVLQAAARARSDSPLVCLSGNPATVGTRLLRALIAAGNPIRYHGDFDWPGVAIAGRVIAAGATAWRMSATDYQAAVAGLDSDQAVALTGKPVGTPWDPALASAMVARGLAVHEESVLPDLLADL